MKEHIIRGSAPLLVITLILSTINDLVAQSSLVGSDNSRFIRIELDKPVFENGDDIGFLTLATFINGQFPVSDNVALIFELPVAFASFDGESSTGVGNIGVGLNVYGQQFSGHFSIGIPTADDSEAAFAGIFADVTERFNAFNSENVPIKVYGNLLERPVEGFAYRVRGGFDLTIPTDDFGETELLFGLTALAGYAFSGGLVQAGLSTITILTEEDLDFSERVIESIVMSGEFGSGNIVPGVILRIPIDADLSDLYNLVVGVSVDFKLN
ncbi:MAG: hypothetical protein R3330_05605 [Saprospiraceae bacterium]|nr:hypothetical protein [Saprospiraceae bacterium]